MLRRGVLPAIIGLLICFSSGAEESISGPAIDPLSLKCLLRERKFFTEIFFTRNSEGLVVGEMHHYVSVKPHGRRFLSGNVFFDITSDEGQIRGFTGDPRGIVFSFSLRPLQPTQLNGKWRYLQTELNDQRTEVLFHCVYGGQT